MGSHTFTWPHRADEVYVTGTFDNWQKTVKLEKHAYDFHKTVDLPAEKILYKFVVDGNWTTDHTAPQEQDHQGISNNVLTVEELKPAPSSHSFLSSVSPESTTTAMAGRAPLARNDTVRDQAPGAWPETPANELQQFNLNSDSAPRSNPDTIPETPNDAATTSETHENAATTSETPDDEARQLSVNPIPATSSAPVPGGEGSSNPIKLAAGEPVPDPSTFTSNTIDTHVKHERSESALDEAHNTEGTEITHPAEEAERALSVNPLPATAGIGNPIKLAPGEPVPDSSTFTNNTVQSTVGDMRSASGAPQLPPILSPSSEQEANGGSMFDLPPIGSGPGPMIPESSLPMGGAAGFGGANFTPALSSVAPQSTSATLAGAVPIRERGVPQVVTDSDEAAHESPEAAAYDESVEQKSAVEEELKSVVPEASGTETVGEGNAIEVPAVVTESQHRAHAEPEATASPIAVEEKSNMENELKAAVPEAPATSESGMFGTSERGLAGAIAGGALAAGGLFAAAAYATKDKAAEYTQPALNKVTEYTQPALDKATEYTQPALDKTTEYTQPALDKASEYTGQSFGQNDSKSIPDAPAVPETVVDSQHTANASPEASANPEAVSEKSAMENELKSVVSKEPATSESGVLGSSEGGISGKVGAGIAAGTAAFAGAAGYAGLSGNYSTEKSTDAPAVPETVVESQHIAHASPEASANLEAVSEKSAMENELKSVVSKEPATSESGALGSSEGGISGKVGAGIAAGTATVAGAAGYAGLSGNESTEKSIPEAPAVPETVVESQHVAHASPEASANPEAVSEKSAMENELKSVVHEEPATSESGALGKSEGGISGKIGAGIAAGTAAIAGAAGYAGLSGRESSDKSTPAVPSTVTDSQLQAQASPEASADAEAVREKSAVEEELKSVVHEEPATSESGVFGSSESGLLGKLTGQTPADQDASTDKSIPAAPPVPEVVTDSQHAAHVDPEAAAEPEVVQEKSAMEEELKAKVPEEPATSESGLLGNSEGGISGKVAGGVAAGTAVAGAAVAGYAYSARDKAAEATGQDKHSFLPSSVQSAIDSMNHNKGTTAPAYDFGKPADLDSFAETSSGLEESRESAPISTGLNQSVPEQVVESQKAAHFSPEASANPEAVAEKSQMERELLSEVKPHNESGEPAPVLSGLGEFRESAPVLGGLNQSVPEQVVESQKAAHFSPEASANPEAVAEKSQMERELLSEVKPHNESGEPAPVSSAAFSAIAPAATTGSTLGSSTSGLKSFEAPDFGSTVIKPFDQPTGALPELPLGATAATTTQGLTESASREPASAAAIAERVLGSDSTIIGGTSNTMGSSTLQGDLNENVATTSNSAYKSPLQEELKENIAPTSTSQAAFSGEQEQTKAPTLTALANSTAASSSTPVATEMNETAPLKKEKSPFDPKPESERLAAPSGPDSRDVSPMSKGPRAPGETSNSPTSAPVTPSKDKVKRSSSFFRKDHTPNSVKTSGTAEGSSPGAGDKPKKKSFFGRLKDKLAH